MSNDDNNSIKRRRFLQLAGASVISTGVAAGKGNAQPTPAHEGPYHVSGRRVHRYVPDGEVYQHHEKFISDELKDPYGTSIVKFEINQVARERIPDDYKNPDTTFQTEWTDTAVIGSREEFAADERNKSPSKTEIGAKANPKHYYGPLYAYKNGSKMERASPINVGWYNLIWTPNSVKNIMENEFGIGSYNSPIAGYSLSRYILGVDGGLESEDAEVAKIPPGALPFAQWHVRLWKIDPSESNRYPVIGQAHYDVRDHGIITDPSFQFSASRSRVLTDWRDYTSFSTKSIKIYNGTGYPDDDSSEGKFGIIHD